MRPGNAVEARLEVIPEDECTRLLAAHEVGRLGVVHGGWPLVVPVNYAWDGSGVVFRTDTGTLAAAASGAAVALEVDEVEPDARRGWSVLVRGRCVELDRPRVPGVEHVGPGAVEPSPWAPGPKARWLRIEPVSISGRRIVRRHRARDELWRLSASS